MKSAKILILVFVSAGIVAGAIALLMTARPVADRGTSEKARMALKSLPYLDWQPVSGADIRKRGVTVHEQDKSYEGLNVYNHDNSPKCYLMDMSGTVLHVWSRPERNLHHAEPMRNGDLLAIAKDSVLLRLDWESNIEWTSDRNYHHDVTVADNGNIYALTWDVLRIPFGPATIPIVNDYVTILAPDGTIREDISIFRLFGNEVTDEERGEIREFVRSKHSAGEKIKVEPQTVFDVFHTNTVDIVETDIEGVARKGDVLICIRNLDIVAVIDISAGAEVWRLDRHDLEKPHQPSFVGGNLLVFDNGAERRYSRVLEIDPGTGETVWEYTASPKEAFFSLIRGGCQRLPNGNTLICESNKARVFEVTPQGKIVWEFYGTEVKVKKALKLRRPIYRMARLAPDYLTLPFKRE